jgi:hypothetical protein
MRSLEVILKPSKIAMFMVFAVYGILFSGCDGELNTEIFDYNLRGTWINIYGDYEDKLVITGDTIEISPDPYYYYTPYIPGLTGYTPNTALKGYSEKSPDRSDRGSIFINDRGDWQTAVPYKLWHGSTDPRLTIGDDSDPMDINKKYTTFKKQ